MLGFLNYSPWHKINGALLIQEDGTDCQPEEKKVHSYVGQWWSGGTIHSEWSEEAPLLEQAQGSGRRKEEGGLPRHCQIETRPAELLRHPWEQTNAHTYSKSYKLTQEREGEKRKEV